MKPYHVTPLYEPNGEGSGWYDAPSDKLATFYSVDSADVMGFDGADTRAKAQAICDRMNLEA